MEDSIFGGSDSGSQRDGIDPDLGMSWWELHAPVFAKYLQCASICMCVVFRDLRTGGAEKALLLCSIEYQNYLFKKHLQKEIQDVISAHNHEALEVFPFGM